MARHAIGPRRDKNITKHAIRNRLTGEKEGHAGAVHPNKASTGGKQAKPHPFANLGMHQLKKQESALLNTKQAGHLASGGRQRLNTLRHQLTTRLLGGTHGEGFNPGLSQKGQHKATRQLLRAKLGSKFSDYYYTGGGGQQNRAKSPPSLGTVSHPGQRQRTNLPHGGYLGPPNRRRKGGFGGY